MPGQYYLISDLHIGGDEALGVCDFQNELIAFIYGHTHTPFIKQKGNRFVINTGTWPKQLERVALRFGLLPAIHVPHYNCEPASFGWTAS